MSEDPLLQVARDAVKELACNSDDGTICFEWLPQTAKDSGVTPHHLRRLCKEGELINGDSSRGGSRRYYRIRQAKE